MIIPPKTNSSCNLSNKLKGKIGDAKWLDLYYSGLLFTWTIILTIEAVNFDPVLKDLMSVSSSFKFLNGRKWNSYVLESKSRWYPRYMIQFKRYNQMFLQGIQIQISLGKISFSCSDLQLYSLMISTERISFEQTSQPDVLLLGKFLNKTQLNEPWIVTHVKS